MHRHRHHAGRRCCAIRGLPIAQYPDIAPPQVSIHAIYPGASAETLENTVTQVIEQQLTGIDGLLLLLVAVGIRRPGQRSPLTFEQGTDPDIAQVQVQNKVQQALPRLPQEVQQQGVRVEKSTANFAAGRRRSTRPTSRTTSIDLADYHGVEHPGPIGRIDGVGDVQVFGSQYAMRIWLDPDASSTASS